jgi:hypothetical protein
MAQIPKKIQKFLEELARDNIVPMAKWPEEKQKAYEEKLTRDEEPLVKALEKVGVSVSSVWDLVNTSVPYPAALPVLIEHLSGNYHPKTLAGIARALAVRDPFAIEHAWPVALDLFLRTKADELVQEPEMRGFKEGLAVALSALCTEERLPQVFDLIRDPRHGGGRAPLIHGLRRFRKNEEAKKFLEILSNDPYWGDLARKILKGRR